MRKITHIILFALLISCETIVEIDIPKETHLPAINAIFNVDSVFIAHVSWSNYILDGNPHEVISNAIVTVFDEHEQVIDILNYDKNGYYRSSNHHPKHGHAYFTKAEIPGHGVIEGQTTIPTPPIISSTTSQTTIIDEIRTERYTITIQDDPAIENYYEISIEAFSDSDEEMYWSQYIESEDPILAESVLSLEQSLLFKDDLFNGENIELHLKKFASPGPAAERKGVRFMVKSVGKEYYDYASSLKLQYKLSSDPLAQPVSIKTNVQNGLGLVSSYALASSIYLFPVPEIYSISPEEGRPGDTVKIEGKNLYGGGSGTIVFFYSTSKTGLSVAEITERKTSSLSVKVPPDAVTYKIIVYAHGMFVGSPQEFRVLN